MKASERPLRCLGLLSPHYFSRNPVYTQRCIRIRRAIGVVIDCSREGSIVARGNRSYCVVDCHINMSIKFELCLDSTHRGIMHEGAEIVLPCNLDILARGSAMGELGEYLKAISLIS